MAKRVEATSKEAASHEDARIADTRAPATPWRGGFAGPFASVRLAAQRFGRSWRLLLAVELGMVIAVALLATAPFYGDLVASAQLQSTLIASASSDRNIQIDATADDLAHAILLGIDQSVTADASTYIGAITSGSTEYLQSTRPLELAKINGSPTFKVIGGKCENQFLFQACQGGQVLPMAYDLTQALPYINLSAGRLPHDTTGSAMPEVLVTPAAGLKPGAVVHMLDSQDEKWGFDARVVGVWFPKNENDAFWNGKGFDTVVPTNISNPLAPQYAFLFTRNALISSLTFRPTQEHIPMGIELHYVYFVAPDHLTIGQAKTVSANITALHTNLDADVPGRNGAIDVGLATHLGQLLDSVSVVLAGQTLPLYSVDAQLVALALLFIFVMSGLLIESQAGEIATLKSRGASTTQVLLTYLSQGILLAAVSLVAGVAIAGALALALVRFFVPLARAVSDALTPGYVARAVSPHDALTPAAIGAGLGVLALGLATWQAARMDALAFRREQGRSARIPFWKRYYLDLGLVVLCIAGYAELVSFGSLGTRMLLNSQGGGAGQTDYIQLLAPTLLLLSGALLLQRALPWALRLGAWLTARGRGATGMLAFAHVSRASSVFNRLTLLLTLAVGLGLFSLTFQSTLAHSATDDANYLVGANERVVIQPESQGTQSTLGFAAQFAKMPGVQSVSAMYRGIALTLPNQGGQNVDVLAVDPNTFAQTAIWRSDYAGHTLPSLLHALAPGSHDASVGEAHEPMVALIDQTYASNFSLRVGDRFQLSPQEEGHSDTSSSVYFVVGGIVNAFPSLYDEYPTGYLVVDLNDYLTVLSNPNLAAYPVNGPNEFLLRTTPDAKAASQRATALTDPNFFLQSTLDARSLASHYRADPLIAGMSGLLLLGALIAALLALVGVITQASIAARQRQTQFAILRTLGLSENALTSVLVLEQALVYVFGALGGVAIGALLAVASLPFLGFSTAAYAPPVIGVPQSLLAFNANGSLIYLGVLLVIFVAALVIAALLARFSGLGRALRVGED